MYTLGSYQADLVKEWSAQQCKDQNNISSYCLYSLNSPGLDKKMVFSGKFAFSKEMSQTCELKKTFFSQRSVLFLFPWSSSADTVIPVLPFFSRTVVIVSFVDSWILWNMPKPVGKTDA